MAFPPASSMPALQPWRLLPSTNADGAWQMACDSWLLQRAVDGCHEPVLRFYRWSRPTLSLGFHQRRLEPAWEALAAEGRIDLVRRPSGGRAVLHAGSLTYALIWPAAPVARLEAYARACRWLQEGFAALGLPLHLGDASPRSSAGGSLPGSCFALGTGADLCHGPGLKRIGSAQLRRHGHLLQHGSILVDPPAGLWRALFGEEPPALPSLPQRFASESPLDALERHLIQAALEHLPAALGLARRGEACLPPLQTPLSADDLAAIRSVAAPGLG